MVKDSRCSWIKALSFHTYIIVEAPIRKDGGFFVTNQPKTKTERFFANIRTFVLLANLLVDSSFLFVPF